MKRKAIKKAWSLLLAVLMMTGVMAVTAQASDVVTNYDSDKDAKMTLTKTDTNGNPLAGAGYTLYRVATMTQTGSTISYTVDPSAGYTGSGITSSTSPDDFDLTTFSGYQTAEVTSGDDGVINFNVGTNHGLYLAVETTTPTGVATPHDFLVNLPRTTSDGSGWEYEVEAKPKNSLNDAKISKTVKTEGEAIQNNTVYVGEILDFNIEAKLPTDFFEDNLSGTLIYYQMFDIVDNWGEGLGTPYSVKIEIDGPSGSKTDITSAMTSFTHINTLSREMRINLVNDLGAGAGEGEDRYVKAHPDLKAGDNVYVTYKQKVVGKDDIFNDVWINGIDKEGNGTDIDKPDPEDPDPEVELYSYDHALIKLDDENAFLNGAEFVLKDRVSGKYYAEDTVSSEVDWKLVTDIDDAYRFKSGTKALLAEYRNDGFIHIVGIRGGAQELIETKAPAGYQKLTSPISITFNEASTLTAAIMSSDDAYADLAAADAASAYTTKVTNVANFTLPGTGGAGIYIYLAAGILLIGVALLLFLKNRKKA